MMELQLKIAGVLMVALAFLHLIFPRRFNWKMELSGLSLLNRQLMYVHTFFIALMVLLMGLLCFATAPDLVATSLGHTVAGGLAFFWGVRLVFQFVVYSPKLWRGKRLETVSHVIFAVLWLYFTAVFALVAMHVSNF